MARWSTQLAEIAGRVLQLPAKSSSSSFPSVLKPSAEIQADRWIRKARRRHASSAIQLHLPAVLRILQRLRSADNSHLYFSILNRIHSSNVEWQNLNAGVPIELYHELSNMLYKISTSTHQDRYALAKYSLNLLHKYTIVLHRNNKLYANNKFLRNLLVVVARSKSFFLHSKAISQLELQNVHPSLIKLAQLEFLFQSGQLSQVYTQTNLLLDSFQIPLDVLTCFAPLLFNITKSMIQHQLDEQCSSVLNKLLTKHTLIFDGHDLEILVQLCHRHATYKSLTVLAKNGEHNITTKQIPWKSFQSELNIPQWISLLQNAQVDFFANEYELSFWHTKFSSILGESTWRLQLQTLVALDTTPLSIKSFILNSALTYSAGYRNFGFMLLVLECFLYELHYTEALINCHRLKGLQNQAGFHALFRSAGTSSSAKLATCRLYQNLKLYKEKIPHHFTHDDFYYMMKTCLSGNDHRDVYFFLHEYLTLFYRKLYHSKERKLILPDNINTLLKRDFVETKGENRIIEILDAVESIAQHNKDLNNDTLQKIIGNDYYTAEFGGKPPHDENIARHDRFKMEKDYSFPIDADSASRIDTIFEFLNQENS